MHHSGVHRLLTTSRLSAEHRDMAIVAENVAMPFLRGKAELRLPAALHSAYKTVRARQVCLLSRSIQSFRSRLRTLARPRPSGHSTFAHVNEVSV
eukprot:3848409-Pleurochrysis_carterae.AAC.3